MTRILLIALLLSIGTVFANSNIDQVKVGDKITGPLTIGKNVFPLPSGEWEVANINTYDLKVADGDFNSITTKTDDIKTVQLIKSKQGKLQESMIIETPVNNTTFTIAKNKSPFCDSKTGYFYTDFDSGYDLRECLKVYHATNYFGSKNLNKFAANTKQYLLKNNIEIPKTIVSSLYFFASKRGATTIAVDINPELAGFSPSTITDWNKSEWHKDNQNEQQKKFTDRTAEWAKNMAKAMQKSIKDQEVTEIPDFMETAQ